MDDFHVLHELVNYRHYCSHTDQICIGIYEVFVAEM